MKKLIKVLKSKLSKLSSYRDEFDIIYKEDKNEIVIKFEYLTHSYFILFADFVKENNLLILIAPATINEDKQSVIFYKKV